MRSRRLAQIEPVLANIVALADALRELGVQGDFPKAMSVVAARYGVGDAARLT